MNKHGSELIYIKIRFPGNKLLKFLIDTGASTSFITPEHVDQQQHVKCKLTTIKTFLANKLVILPIFEEFKQKGKLSLLLFKFHNYFDGLLGIDYLSKVGAKIDLQGDNLIAETFINENLVVLPGIYTAQNWFSLLEVTKLGDSEEIIYFDQPLKT